MQKQHGECDNCNAEFSVIYDDEDYTIEFCPACGHYLSDGAKDNIEFVKIDSDYFDDE